MSAPIILIPGIQGTKLVNTNTLDFDTIWSAVQSRYETIYDLQLKQDSRFEVSPNSLIERGDVEDAAYREVVHVLQRKTKMPVYIFGYDWRKSSAENGKRLAAYVAYLKEKLSVTKFNFIAHSMGGMVFSCYLNELQGNYDTIDHGIFAVSPFKGSVSALVALIVGEGGIKFPLFNSNDEFRKISRTFPSVFEMCPTFPNAVVFENGPEVDLFNPDHWQSNVGDDNHPLFLDRVGQMKAFLDPQQPGMLNLKELPAEVRKRFLILTGNGVETLKKVVVEPFSPDGRAKNFFKFDAQDATGDGDGTVPEESAHVYRDVILTLAVKKKWTDLSLHALFLNDGRVQTLLTRFLLNQTTDMAAGSPWWGVLDNSVTMIK